MFLEVLFIIYFDLVVSTIPVLIIKLTKCIFKEIQFHISLNKCQNNTRDRTQPLQLNNMTDSLYDTKYLTRKKVLTNSNLQNLIHK